MEQKIADVLLVEDSVADVALTKAIIKRENLSLNLFVVRDGEEAIAFIKNTEGDMNKIDLILMDFNLPKQNGLDILRFIEEQGKYKDVPVIMLTGSDAPSDMDMAYQLGAKNYMVKPLVLDKLKEAIKDITSLCLTTEESEKVLYAKSK